MSADLVQAVLTEHRHKSPRVQARLVIEAIESRRVELDGELPPVVIHDQQPPDEKSAQAWEAFRSTMALDSFGALVDVGVATTRNRTYNAMRALGLDPSEVRAVVIERDFVRVFYFDRTPGRPSVPQTVPILEDQ